MPAKVASKSKNKICGQTCPQALHDALLAGPDQVIEATVHHHPKLNVATHPAALEGPSVLEAVVPDQVLRVHPAMHVGLYVVWLTVPGTPPVGL
jgi:hypothetical protein